VTKLFCTLSMALSMPLFLTACHGKTKPSTSDGSVATVTDNEMGLLKGSVFDVYTPTAATYVGGEHGSGKTLPRASAGIPPQIPHMVEKGITITLEDNECMMCHNEGDDSPLPASHKRDYFGNGPADDTDLPAPRRQRCLMCHTQASDAKPL